MMDSLSKESRLLSVCMIAKDEEDIIARVIESISPIASEIIVVDTGSSDKTALIAESLGAKVISSDWRNDFSYSRNISIKDATSRWILWLDADDFVPESSLPKIKKIVESKADRVYATVVKNRRPDGTGTSFMQARIFPNFKGIYFERPIHEQMMISALKLGLKLENSDAIIEHLGYIEPEIMKKKAARNCELLLQEYEKNHNDPYMIIEIADSYSIMQDDENALLWYKRLLEIEKIDKAIPDLAGQAYLGLGNIYNKLERYDEARTVLTQGLLTSPNRPDLKYSYAVTLDLLNRKMEAVTVLNEILSMTEYNLKVGVDHKLSKIKSYGRLFTLLTDLSNKDELQKLAKMAESEFGDRADILNYIGRAYFFTGKIIDSLHAFEKSISIQKQGNIAAYIGLIIIYIKAGKSDVAKSTAENIAQVFRYNPVFHALCQMYSLLDYRLLENEKISKEEIDKEKKRIQKHYPM